MYSLFFKRFLDLVISVLILFFLLFTLLPFLSLLYILFSSKTNGMFFTQIRVGKNENIFKLLKLKTMTDEKDINGKLLNDAQRLTKFGKFVRSTSLDELPQLINVVKGDMSLIGPRPLLVKYLPLYSEEQKKRHLVRPGITGLAQVNGRNSINWKEKFEYDVWYVENICFKNDMKIILMTIKNVLQQKGINSATSATMEAFKGNIE